MTKKKTPPWTVVEAIHLAGISKVNNIPDMEGIKNGMELTLTQIKGENEKRTLTLGLCAPTSADKNMWITKLQTFETGFRSSEETSKALQETVLMVRDESHSRPHHRGGSSSSIPPAVASATSPSPTNKRMSLRKGKSQTLK